MTGDDGIIAWEAVSNGCSQLKKPAPKWDVLTPKPKAGEATWFEFAKTIVELVHSPRPVEVVPIRSVNYP
jgi:hypothetical protein